MLKERDKDKTKCGEKNLRPKFASFWNLGAKWAYNQQLKPNMKVNKCSKMSQLNYVANETSLRIEQSLCNQEESH